MSDNIEELKDLLHHSKCDLAENISEREQLKKRLKTKRRIIHNCRKHVKHLEATLKTWENLSKKGVQIDE